MTLPSKSEEFRRKLLAGGGKISDAKISPKDQGKSNKVTFNNHKQTFFRFMDFGHHSLNVMIININP